MNATGDGHSSDGTDAVRRLRKSRFLRPQDSSEFKSQSSDLPVFLATPRPLAGLLEKQPPHEADSQARVSRLVGDFTTTLVKSFNGSEDDLNRFYSGLSLHRLVPSHMREPVARIALILLLASFPIAFSPNGVPRPTKMPTPVFSKTKTAPPEFLLEDRLAFGQGLRDRLAAPTPALDPKNPAIKTPDVDPPRAEAEQQLPTLTTFDSGARENQPLVMDERRWSLPFDSQEYAIADLPVTPEASFRAEITASAFVNEPVSVTAQNDIPVVARVSRSMRKVERRQKVLIQRRIVRVQTLPPAVVAAAIAQQQAYAQQQAAAPPPFLFFLGAPPPSAAPPSEENAPPKKPFLFPKSINDIFKNEY